MDRRGKKKTVRDISSRNGNERERRRRKKNTHTKCYSLEKYENKLSRKNVYKIPLLFALSQMVFSKNHSFVCIHLAINCGYILIAPFSYYQKQIYACMLQLMLVFDCVVCFVVFLMQSPLSNSGQ